MKLIKAIIRPNKLEEVKDALSKVFVCPVEQGYNIRTGERDV